MAQLVSGAAGGILPAVRDGIARETVPYTPDLVADYAGVTGGQPRSDRNVPDVLVGLGWPSVFAVLSQAHTDAGTPVIEGKIGRASCRERGRSSGGDGSRQERE